MNIFWVIAYIITNIIAFFLGWTYGLDGINWLIDNPHWGVAFVFILGFMSGGAVVWWSSETNP